MKTLLIIIGVIFILFFSLNAPKAWKNEKHNCCKNVAIGDPTVYNPQLYGSLIETADAQLEYYRLCMDYDDCNPTIWWTIKETIFGERYPYFPPIPESQ